MVIDTSALLAILQRELEQGAFLASIETAAHPGDLRRVGHRDVNGGPVAQR